MFTILHAIQAAACCRDESKDGSPALRGVVVEWVDLPESDHLPERVVRCSATDGHVLAVVHCDPGKGWPQHGRIVVMPESLKVLAQLLKRVADEIDARSPDEPVRGTIETWCAAYDEEGRPVRPRQVIRVDVPCADDGMILQLAGECVPPNIEAVMTPRKLTMGAPPGRLATNYVQAAQAAVSNHGAPTWYTDGRCAFLFNGHDPARAHDFALVMPIIGADEDREIWPWGRPGGDEPQDAPTLEAIGGDEPLVVAGLDPGPPEYPSVDEVF